jgi:hypothetical protein
MLTLRKHLGRGLNKAHAKAWNRKWSGIKKMFVDKLGYINLLDAITHVEIGKNNKMCTL